jgi:hypothetical protein
MERLCERREERKEREELGMVVHPCNPSSQEAEAGRSQVGGQPGATQKDLTKKEKKRRKERQRRGGRGKEEREGRREAKRERGKGKERYLACPQLLQPLL